MLDKRIGSFIGVKHIQNTVKKANAQCGQQTSANETDGLGTALAQLRNTQSGCKKGVVKKQDLVTGNRFPKSIVANHLPVSREVIEGIAKECGSECGKDHAHPFIPFPVSKERRIEEEIDKQLLEV